MSQASHDAKSGFQFFKKLLGVEERDTRKEKKKKSPKRAKKCSERKPYTFGNFAYYTDILFSTTMQC